MASASTRRATDCAKIAGGHLAALHKSTGSKAGQPHREPHRPPSLKLGQVVAEMNQVAVSFVLLLLVAAAMAAPQFGLFGPSGTGAGIGGGNAGFGGVSAFGAGVASGQNGGIGIASGQGSASGNPFFGFNAQGTGNGFGFGK